MQSKRPRRKLISLKELDKISPFKDIESKTSQPSHQQANSISKPTAKPSYISAYKPVPIQINNSQQKAINDAPACIRSIELISLISNRSLVELQDYFQENDPILKTSFKNLQMALGVSLQLIKQQRLQTQNQNQVVYAHPDKDHYEMHKTKHYSILIQEQMALYDSKRTFDSPQFTLKPHFDVTLQHIRTSISRQSEKLSKEMFDRQFGRVIEQQRSTFGNELQLKKSQVKQSLLGMLQIVQKMRIQNQKRGQIECMKKKLHRQKVMMSLFDVGMGLQVCLLRPEHLLSE